MSVDTAEQFYEQLQSSRLLTAEQLADLHEEVLADKALAASRFADSLIERGVITDWQARQMLAARHAFFVGKYKLLERLGVGGMGTVYKAYHPMTDRIVALKLVNKAILANPPAVARFRTEVRLICSLNHPNIITAYDADSVGEMHFLVMEFGQGRDLRSWLKEFGPLPINWACDCIRQAALALDHAHQRGLVHRDIKPENLLVEGADPTTSPRVKLLDMGLARLMGEEPAEDAALASAGKLMGTPDYISPEQATAARDADIRSDIYSLGTTFFKILTDRVPFEGGDLRQRLMARLLTDAPRVSSCRADVPPELDEVVARMLAREPDDRFQTPVEVAQALYPYTFEGERIGTGPAGENAAVDSALGNFFNRLSEEQDAVAAPRASKPVATKAVRNVSEGSAPVIQIASEEPTAVARQAAITVPAAVVPLNSPGTTEPEVAEQDESPTNKRVGERGHRKGTDRRNMVIGVAVGAALALPVVGVMYWMVRPATLVIEWPAKERRGAQLLIDGDPEGIPRGNPVEISLSPGKHRVVLRRRGYDPIEWNVDLARGDREMKRVAWEKTDLSQPFTFGRSEKK